MSSNKALKPRGYQKRILKLSNYHVENGSNVLIELDCGLGKRFLQYSVITQLPKDSKLLLILQSSTSLYETKEYLDGYLPDLEISIIDSRLPSKIRSEKLEEKQVVLSLPQTLFNTLRKFPDSLGSYDLVVINEVDQLIKRMGTNTSLKHPYPKLLPFFSDKILIGMSGTLRDNHYVVDQEQIKIKKELYTLINHIGNAQLITMDMLEPSDLDGYIRMSRVIATAVDDKRMKEVSSHLDGLIEEAKEVVLDIIKKEDPSLYGEIRRDFSKMFGPLPVPPSIAQKFHRGYLVRKYLWSMPGETSYRHLIRFGIDKSILEKSLPRVPAKFLAVRDLVSSYKKSVVLCSYLDTVDTLEQLIKGVGIKTVKITGEVNHNKRLKKLNSFRDSSEQMVAILSNVGERDLDIPEAELLIIFDLVRTIKTVYQKLKRSRGGDCRILYYDGTREDLKVKSVIKRIGQKYNWSTKILPPEKISV